MSNKKRLARHRKAKLRTATGRPSRAKPENVLAVVLAQPHRAWLPEGKRTDQRAESLLGRLRLASLLSEAQYESGQKWRGLMAEFSYLLATPARPQNPLARVAADDPPIDAPTDDDIKDVIAETDEERRDRVLRSVGDVNAELRRIGRHGQSLAALEAVILHDRALDDYGHLVRALNALARLWKIPDCEYSA